MKTHVVGGLVLGAALALALPAQAQGRSEEFERRDRNNDGVISKAEYGGHAGNFAAFDRDGDGVLTHDEFVNRPTETDRGPETGRDGLAWRDAKFHEMDRDDDNAVSRAEWRGSGEHFDMLDADGNGRIEGDEYSNPKRLEGWFRAHDRNRDGVVDRREFKGRSLGHWDVDGDGKVTRREILL